MNIYSIFPQVKARPFSIRSPPDKSKALHLFLKIKKSQLKPLQPDGKPSLTVAMLDLL